MKKIFLAIIAVASIAMVGCKNDKEKEPETEGTQVVEPKDDPKDDPQDIKEVQARFNDTIVMSMLMPGYTSYTVEIDNKINGIVQDDTVFVQCIGETTLHITADRTAKKDVKLTVLPYLTEEYMFSLPKMDWTRNRDAVVKELGEPVSRVFVGDSCFAYYPEEPANPVIYYYFNGEDYNTLIEIVVAIPEEQQEHGELLKLFIAERFPFVGADKNNTPPVWMYSDALRPFKDNTTILQYYQQSGWNVSFRPYYSFVK